jgi:HK97 family phage major capsid protein
MKTALAMAATAPILAATPGTSFRPRGLMAVRNEPDINKVLAEMNKAFAEFKTSNDERIKALEAKKAADPLDQAKLGKINDEITALQKVFDESQRTIAALKLGAGGKEPSDTPEKAEHAKAWNKNFRTGTIEPNAMRDLAVKAKLTTDSDPDGGYLVPEEVETTIDRIMGTVTAMRSIARVITIGTNMYKKPMNMGGAGSGWVGEREARTETGTPTINELEFPVMQMYANPAATQDILDDGRIDIAAWLGDEVSITFGEQEGAAFIVGNGTNKPRGLLNYNTVANAQYAWGSIGFIASGNSAGFINPSSTASPADCLVALYYALKQGYRAGASWLTSDAVMGTIRQFKDGQGNYIWAPPAGESGVPTILGKPVSTDDNMQALGANAFPVAFGDFKRAYLIIDRAGIKVLRDPYTNTPYVMFKTFKRVGGGIQNYEAVKLLKCA